MAKKLSEDKPQKYVSMRGYRYWWVHSESPDFMCFSINYGQRAPWVGPRFTPPPHIATLRWSFANKGFVVDGEYAKALSAMGPEAMGRMTREIAEASKRRHKAAFNSAREEAAQNRAKRLVESDRSRPEINPICRKGRPIPCADSWQVHIPLTEVPGKPPKYFVLTKKGSLTPRIFLRWSAKFDRFMLDDHYRRAREVAGDKVLERITRQVRRYQAILKGHREGVSRG